MWRKTRRLNALLAPLGAVINGEVSDGCLSGSFGGYAVQAHPHAGYPIAYLAGNSGVPPESVNMFQVTSRACREAGPGTARARPAGRFTT
jgi:hypothetical protein